MAGNCEDTRVRYKRVGSHVRSIEIVVNQVNMDVTEQSKRVWFVSNYYFVNSLSTNPRAMT
jgi:hypothetical protein